MANFVVALDSNPVRCREYAREVQERIAPFPGLTVEARAGEDWAVAWAAGHRAPVSIAQEGERAAFVWGMPIDDLGQVQTAQRVRAGWEDGRRAVWDGFYAAAVVESGGALSVGADLLGLFPVYYWQGSGVVLVASSIALIASHPAYSAKLDSVGMVGILMTNGLLDGRTILKDVRRLQPSHQLVARDHQLREEVAYQVPESLENRSLPFAGHVELLADVFRKTVHRHISAVSECGLLLSGGLDSRLLAGALVQQGVSVSALTFGLAEEDEAKCARGVATALGIRHTIADVPVDAFPAAAEALAKWDCLCSGFSTIPDWTMVPEIARLPSRVVLGHVLDGVAGGIHVGWAYDPREKAMTGDQFINALYRWGFTPHTLRNLLEPEYHVFIEEVLERFRATYDSWSEQPYLRAWHADLRTRQRYHVGISLWISSFSAWPVAPTLDRALMEVAASLPASSLADRRAQFGILRHMFPELAKLKLDRNSSDTMPPEPRLRHYVERFARDKAARAVRVMGLRGGARKQRFYERLYDLDSPAWMQIRRRVEPYHHLLPDAIRRDAIARWLPPATRRLSFVDPISEPGRIKTLMGLALVCRNHSLR